MTLQVATSGVWIFQVRDLCEEVDALLSIEVAVTQERSPGSGEAHHRQGNRDWHIHLGAELLKAYFSSLFGQ